MRIFSSKRLGLFLLLGVTTPCASERVQTRASNLETLKQIQDLAPQEAKVQEKMVAVPETEPLPAVSQKGDCAVWIMMGVIISYVIAYCVLCFMKPEAKSTGNGTEVVSTLQSTGLASAQEEVGVMTAIASDLDDHATGKLDEGGAGSRAAGAMNMGLFSEKYSGSNQKKASWTTFIFSEGFELLQTPGKMRFLQSHVGLVYQGMLIFLYMHFDAGLPILQDVYKVYYGGGKLLFLKQSLLITQNICEIACLFTICFYLRGSIWDCINPRKSMLFAPAGACFGIQAVFGFMAMSEITADCYALYSQTSIIVLTLAWTIFFRQRLSGTAWCGIVIIAIGMAGFNMSDDKSTSRGLLFIGLKVCTQSFACLYAEKFIKSDPEVLYIQMAWIKPVELVSTIIMLFVIPPKPGRLPVYEEITEQGFFHDWNYLVVIIMIFNMGDTFMTATVAKRFDSVVKGVAGVFDIIYPTQVLVQFIEPPEYTPLKVVSALQIFFGSLTFVLAKNDMRKTKDKDAEIEKLKLGSSEEEVKS